MPESTQRAADGFLEANRRILDFSTSALSDALQFLVELAVDCLHSCDWAAITSWPPGRFPVSLASTDPVATRVDQIQYGLLQGPCLTASVKEIPVSIPELQTDTEWPDFSGAVLKELPVRSILAVPLGHHPDRAVLNAYSATPSAFLDAHDEEAATFAAQAAGLLLHARTAERAAHFAQALDSNRQIAMAMGVLMAKHSITSDEALALLKLTSNRRKRKVRHVAAYVVMSGALPDGSFE